MSGPSRDLRSLTPTCTLHRDEQGTMAFQCLVLALASKRNND